MSYITCVLPFLLALASVFGDIYPSDSYISDESELIKSLLASDNSCHGSRATRDVSTYPLFKILGNVKTDLGNMEYTEPIDEDYSVKLDYNDYEEKPTWPKRSSASPFISLGALSNLPQFFEQLKGTMDRLDRPGAHQGIKYILSQPAETDRSFRPPATAAVLHAFRNYRPLRRTRSYPPALVHG